MKTRLFKCEQCTMRFDTEIRLQKHFVKAHTHKKEYYEKRIQQWIPFEVPINVE